MNNTKNGHIPVLLNESLDILDIAEGETIVDATLGAGGHTEAFLKAVGKNGAVLAIEANPTTAQKTQTKLKHYGNLTVVQDNFRNVGRVIQEARSHNAAFERIDHIFFDLGLSSMELADPTAGFSFQVDAPLNMRLDQKTQREGVLTAYAVVNKWKREELRQIIKEYGEEQYATRIANAIVTVRNEQPIRTTTQLAAVIEGASPRRGAKIHPATKTFQAIRIAVNDELQSLQRALDDGIKELAPGGTIAAISFHSLEDRIVKRTLKNNSKACECDPEAIICECSLQPLVEVLTKKPITPTDEEIATNPRARSAKLRAAQKRAP